MALRLKILGPLGEKMGERGAMEFGSDGGTIGRSLDCNWPLPDRHRYLSSRHASIDFRGGCYYIVDTSTNGVYVNDAEQPVGRGKPQRLFNGDRVRMGEYVLAVEIEDDTIERLIDQNHVNPVPLAHRVEAPSEPTSEMVDAFEITGVGIEMMLTEDEIETLTPPRKGGDSFFEFVLDDDAADPTKTVPNRDQEPPRARSAALGARPPRSRTHSASSSGKPDDAAPRRIDDDAAHQRTLSGTPAQVLSSGTLAEQMQSDRRAQRIANDDAASNTSAAIASSTSAATPSAAANRPGASTASPSVSVPPSAGAATAFSSPSAARSANKARPSAAPSVTANRAADASPADAARAVHPASPPAAASAPPSRVASTAAARAANPTPPRAVRAPGAPGAAGALGSAPGTPGEPGSASGADDAPRAPGAQRQARAGGVSLPSPAEATPRAADAGGSGPLAAFFRGAGIDSRRVGPHDSEALLQKLGQTMREMVAGLAETLHVCAQQKDLFALDRDDPLGNPLKSDQAVEERLLALLLANDGPAASVIAVRAAFEDVTHHQQIMLKAVRNALDAYIARLDPDEVEQKYGGEGRSHWLLRPANKLKYWDLYKDVYDVVAHHPPGELPMQFLEDLAIAYRELTEGSGETVEPQSDAREAI